MNCHAKMRHVTQWCETKHFNRMHNQQRNNQMKARNAFRYDLHTMTHKYLHKYIKNPVHILSKINEGNLLREYIINHRYTKHKEKRIWNVTHYWVPFLLLWSSSVLSKWFIDATRKTVLLSLWWIFIFLIFVLI